MDEKLIRALFQKHASNLVDDLVRIADQRMVPTVVEIPEREELPSYRLEMAKRIHGTRSRLGRTKESVAEAVGIPVRVLEQLEAGSYFPKNGSVLIRLAEELGVDPFDLDPRFDPGGPLSSEPKANSNG